MASSEKTKECNSKAKKLREDIEYNLKNYFKYNSREIFDLAQESGFSPSEVYLLINNSSMPFDKLLSLYQAFERMKNNKQQESIKHK